jgi:hypothetical protein
LDVLAIYEQITGEKLDLNIEPSEDEDYWNFGWIILITKIADSDDFMNDANHEN